MSFDPATGVDAKLERANQHIRDLNDLVNAFIDSNPYRLVGDFDEKSNELAIQIYVDRQLHIQWSAIAGDAVHNLRSALDTLWAFRCLMPSHVLTLRSARSGRELQR